MATDTGINLLNPTKNPMKNTVFLAFLAAVIKAVDDHADLLRCSIATHGKFIRIILI
jgi:glutamine synthetase